MHRLRTVTSLDVSAVAGHHAMPAALLFFSIFSGAGKFCLAHGLRRLTRETKCSVSCLQTSLTRRNEKLRMTFGVGT